MKAVPVEIGGTKVLFGSMRVDFDGQSFERRSSDESPLIRTSLSRDLGDAFDEIKKVIGTVAKDVGGHLRSAAQATGLKEAELEFGVGLSSETKAIVIAGKAEASLKVRLTWDFNHHE